MNKLNKKEKIKFLQTYYNSRYYLKFSIRDSIKLALNFPKTMEIPDEKMDECESLIKLNQDVFIQFENKYPDKGFIKDSFLKLKT